MPDPIGCLISFVLGVVGAAGAGAEDDVAAGALCLAAAGGGFSETPAMMPPISSRETRALRRGLEPELGVSVGAGVASATWLSTDA